ncbi:HAD family hydrolase [Pseudogemmobacter sonorensis]|uniref:HAD family hydrolase n=1 Tax=Pseudogemmobacter sonorensis TaxID=2989681 RepID=UPI00369DD98F
MSGFAWQAVAWDIDGTLVDSEPLHHRALLAATAEFGADLSPLPETAFVGVHLKDVWQALRSRLPTGADETEFYRRINHHYAAGAGRLVEIPGATAVIRALDALGVRQVCASNSARAVVDANLAMLGVAGIISASVSLDDVGEGKPAPEPYLRAAALAGTDPARTLAVEDSLTGARAARAAGLSVALLAPLRPDSSAPVDFHITRLDDILHLQPKPPVLLE